MIEVCAVALSVTSLTLMEVGILPNAAMMLLLSRVLFLVVTMAYYYHLGRKPKKIWVDGAIGQGRGWLSTGHKNNGGVKRCEILFVWGLHRVTSWMSPAPVYCNPPLQFSRSAEHSHIEGSPARMRKHHGKVKSSLSGPCWHTFLPCSLLSTVNRKELAVVCFSCLPPPTPLLPSWLNSWHVIMLMYSFMVSKFLHLAISKFASRTRS